MTTKKISLLDVGIFFGYLILIVGLNWLTGYYILNPVHGLEFFLPAFFIVLMIILIISYFRREKE